MNKISNLLWGLVFIVVGVIIGLNAFDITDINIFFDGWWTLFIIVPCFIGLFKDEDKTGNLIGLIIGVCLLLGCIDIVEFSLIWKLIVPAILVMIGLSFIFKDTLNSKIRKEIKKLNKTETKEYCSCFSGQTIDFNNEEFMGCSISAIFGGVKCDLRNAVIERDVAITTSSIFGGIDIFVPDDVNVKVNSNSLFGGVDVKKHKNTNDNRYTLYVNSTCIFGGVDIK